VLDLIATIVVRRDFTLTNVVKGWISQTPSIGCGPEDKMLSKSKHA
jgi:hypothetical protein